MLLLDFVKSRDLLDKTQLSLENDYFSDCDRQCERVYIVEGPCWSYGTFFSAANHL